MSKLTFRARTLDVGKPMAIYKAEDLPELATENAINRAVPALPTGMEKEEETEKHLQDILEAQTKGLVKKVAELVIPTPEVTEEVDTDVNSLYRGTFKQTRQYIHVQPLTADQDKPDYDMDEDDIRFFEDELKERRKFEVSLITFEDMIDRLEKNSGQNVVSLKEAKMLLKEDDDLILAVYDYWLNKRLELQQCLIPVVKSEPNREQTAGQAPNPYVAFRRRTEKMQTRKNRKNEEDSYIRMLKLRRDINRVVMILDMVKRREKLKKERLNLTADVYSKRYEAQDWDGSLLQQVVAQRPTKTVSLQPYPLSSWMNVASSDHLMPLKREKRIYRKRKHHRSGLMRNGISGLLRGDRTLLPLIPDPFSSDEDRGSGIGGIKLAEGKADEADEDDGPFAFRRKLGVEYRAPLEDLTADLDRHEDDDKYFSVVASLDSSRRREYLGFCRRRIGRGGRVVIDRIPSKWESLDYPDVLYGDENRCLRPLTPDNLTCKDWDPYRVLDQEICAN